MKAYEQSNLTLSEYLQLEQDTGQKHEYHNGEVYALAGGSLEHALLIGNCYAAIRSQLEGKGCKPIVNDAKLHIQSQNKYVYPDVMVVCGPIEKSKDHKDALINPTVIVEVLSDSTSDYDRGDKFYFYRQIPSLKEYVLIAQDRPVVEVYFKQERSDLWRISRYEGMEGTLQLRALGIRIGMEELYFDLAFGE